MIIILLYYIISTCFFMTLNFVLFMYKGEVILAKVFEKQEFDISAYSPEFMRRLKIAKIKETNKYMFMPFLRIVLLAGELFLAGENNNV